MIAGASTPTVKPELRDDALAAHLVGSGVLAISALERAERAMAASQDRLVPVLSKLGIVAEPALVSQLAAFYRVPVIAPADFPDRAIFAETLSQNFLLHHHILPVRMAEDRLVAAMADPGDSACLRAIEFFAKCQIIPCVAGLTDIDAAIQDLYGAHGAAPEKDMPQSGVPQDSAHYTADAVRIAELASDAPVIRIMNALIAEAVETGASDIHIEPFLDHVRVRLRKDGYLHEQARHPVAAAMAMASRVKVMAGLNIAERRLPQDGRFRFSVRGRDIDIRVSTAPTVHGESVVLRILDQGFMALDFSGLGFSAEVQQNLEKLLQRPHGIVLVTGPTGSGKTTTLYAALRRLNTADRKILTIEDPVEYQLEGINQQAVQPQIGRTFASALRGFLRQDPDIIMVGEIRDTETAKIAVQAALTGHLILATLHTNDAPSAIARLQDMGVDDYLLASTVTGIVGQRLVRCLCAACRQPSASQQVAGLPVAPRHVKNPEGCNICQHTGYRGRTTLAELLVIDEPVRRLILDRADASRIAQHAAAQGMQSMYHDGLAKVAAGITSLEEVMRVTQEK